MKRGWIVLAVVGGLVLMGGCTLVGSYNRLVTMNEGIDGKWAQVENQLQRRADLVPNLVNTVKGYAKHEKALFEHIADARAAWAGAKTVPEKIKANEQMESALARLMVVVERYPDLKASANFRALQDELAGTENRIAVERGRYNEVVRGYNTLVKRFPSNVVAGWFGFGRKDAYFKAEEKASEVPSVNF